MESSDGLREELGLGVPAGFAYPPVLFDDHEGGLFDGVPQADVRCDVQATTACVKGQVYIAADEAVGHLAEAEEMKEVASEVGHGAVCVWGALHGSVHVGEEKLVVFREEFFVDDEVGDGEELWGNGGMGELLRPKERGRVGIDHVDSICTEVFNRP